MRSTAGSMRTTLLCCLAAAFRPFVQRSPFSMPLRPSGSGRGWHSYRYPRRVSWHLFKPEEQREKVSEIEAATAGTTGHEKPDVSELCLAKLSHVSNHAKKSQKPQKVPAVNTLMHCAGCLGRLYDYHTTGSKRAHRLPESAGELSIREQKFLKLAKAYQQLAAENANQSYERLPIWELRGYESDGAFEGPKIHLLWWQVETPPPIAS